MKHLTPLVLAAAAFMAAAPSGVATQATRRQPELTASEKSLVAGSREAVIKTGMTADYFDRHFRVERVVDRPADRRVVWRFSVGGYAALVTDSVGFYTEGGRRFDTHSVAATLNSTSDLKRTIPRARAEKLLRRCIGRFKGAGVEYRAHGPEREAALLLTASSLVVPRAAHERGEREGRERRESARRQRPRPGSTQTDPVEEEDEGGDGRFVLLGAVDLSNGKCSVGRGQAGPPVPTSRNVIRD